MEQHIGQPRLQAAVSSEHGNFTLVAYLHPVENMLVVNITASNAVAVTVSTWALNSSSSPSRAAVHGSVGTVTRQAVNSSGGFVLHTGLRCGGDLGLIGHDLTLQQCEANCTASARCGAFSYCDAAAGATGCAVPTAGMTSRCFQFADMSQCEGSQVGWTSGLKRVPRPKPDKQIVAACMNRLLDGPADQAWLEEQGRVAVDVSARLAARRATPAACVTARRAAVFARVANAASLSATFAAATHRDIHPVSPSISPLCPLVFLWISARLLPRRKHSGGENVVEHRLALEGEPWAPRAGF
jgi:hypothetical protein